ncbi:hypothetical protein WJX79_004916 [Trebouxia sp. C0005]
MVKSNQVANQSAEPSLEPQASNALALKLDGAPLLRQGSAKPQKSQKSLPKLKATAAKKHSFEGGADDDKQDASKASLQLVLGEWEAPDDKAAKLVHVKTHYHHELFSLSDTKTEDLAEFGQGLALYFYFLKWIAMLLAAMSIVVFPNMVWAAIARKDGTSTTGVLVSTSLGAFGPLFGSDYVYNATALDIALTALGVTFPNDQLARELELEFYYQNASTADATVDIPIANTITKQQLQLIGSWLDLASVLLYLVIVLFIIWYQQRILEEVSAKTVTVIDYSVQVWDLPKDAQTEEVQAYFCQWGPVNSCQLAHNDSALIALTAQQGHLQAKYEHAVAAAQKSLAKDKHVSDDEDDDEDDSDQDQGADLLRAKKKKKRKGRPEVSAADRAGLAAGHIQSVLKVQKKLQQLQESIKAKREDSGQRRCVCAFVTFKTEEARLKCMQANPSSVGKRWAQRRDRRFRKRHALRVGPAPEPSDVVWENLEFSVVQRLQRSFFILVLNLLIIFVGFILVNLSASWRHNSTNLASDPPACASSCGILSTTSTLNLTTTSALALRYKGCHGEAAYDGETCTTLEQSCFACYCSIAVEEFTGFTYCRTYWAKYLIQVLILVAAALITTATNKLLYYFAAYTNPFERHHTVSAEKRSLTLKLFMAQFVNTALSSLVANMYIPALYKRLHDTFLGTLIFQGIYGDLVPAWYAQVGQSLTIVIVFTVGLPHPAYVLYRLMMYKWQLRQRKSCLTQEELVKAYEGPDFDLADRYGELLNILFCTLMFSGGLPILLPCVSIIFAVTYWAEKWELLKLSRVPSPYAGDLAALTGELLPWAALFHLVFSVWAFSWAKWPQTADSPLASSIFGTYVRKVGTAFRKVLFEGWATQDFGNRVLQPNAVPHALALVILLALLMVRLFGAQALHLASQAFALLGMGRSNKYKLDNLPSLAIAVRSRLLVGPGSYSMEKDEKYAELFAVVPAENTLLKGNQDRKAPRKPSKGSKASQSDSQGRSPLPLEPLV